MRVNEKKEGRRGRILRERNREVRYIVRVKMVVVYIDRVIVLAQGN